MPQVEKRTIEAIGLSINGDTGEMISLRHQRKAAPTVLELQVQEIIII
jgi:hypothetical protein